MTRATLTTRCPHCEGPLVLQRAAPGDAALVIVCSDCGACSRASTGQTIETIRLSRPAALTAVTRPGKV